MIEHVKIDKLAHDIAVKARAQCVREAAKAHVAFQNSHGLPHLSARAKLMEERAREWQRKAHLALNPITKDDVAALLARIDDDTCELIVIGHDICGNEKLEYVHDMGTLVGIYNAAADYLNDHPLDDFNVE